MDYTEDRIYLYVTTPLDGKARKFFLEEIDGEEGISGLFHYRLKLTSGDNRVDFTQIVGQKVTVTIMQYSGTERHINGTVSRFIQGGFDGKHTIYYMEIRPWLWQLTLTSNSKIFQNQTVLDIIKAVFGDLGLTDFDVRIIMTYKQREYCVQYQETAFEFVSRLMEDEGIFYFFEHTQDKHILVIADDMDAHQPCPGLAYARMRYASLENRSDDNFITHCTLEQQMIPNKYATEDFNFKTPDTDLLTSVDGKEKGSFRIYEFPGNFEKTDDGETLSDKRIEAYELPQKILKGQGFCRAFISGYKFDLQEHDRDDMNVMYVLKNLFIRADQDGYVNTFEAFPADVPFRPARTTRKPKIPGTQTAIVVGRKGEEIDTDEYGRVKVQFHWDQEGRRNENSSCWIRVAQIWAGKGWGTFFIPRMGTEAIVSFLEGDPDRPIITGTVYNAVTVPYNLPADKNINTMKTVSTPGGKAGNELRFNDTKGKEELYEHAQKDKKSVIENQLMQTVKSHAKNFVMGKLKEIVKKQVTKIFKSNCSKAVLGAETHVVKGNFTQKVGGNYSSKVKGNYDLKIDGDLTIEAKGKVTIKGSEIHLNP